MVARLVQVLTRRWAIVLVGVLATGGLLYGTTRVVAPDNSVTATVLLLPPSVTLDGGKQKSNPYLQLGGLTPPAEVLARALNDPSVRDEVIPAKSPADYLALRDMTTSAPILLITATSPDLADARNVRDNVLRRVPVILKELQTAIGVPSTSQLTSSVITPESTPEKQSRTVVRALLVVLVLSLGATVAVAGAVDSILLRRRDRGSSRHGMPVRGQRSST